MHSQDVFLQSVLGRVTLVTVIHWTGELWFLLGGVPLLMTSDMHVQAAPRGKASITVFFRAGEWFLAGVSFQVSLEMF